VAGAQIVDRWLNPHQIVETSRGFPCLLDQKYLSWIGFTYDVRRMRSKNDMWSNISQ